FKDFNPMQKKCLDKLDKSLVVSAPTASGKTIVAELFVLNSVLNKRKKVIYTCPLRALASEHYKDFKKKYPQIKFSLSTGDLDSSSSYLKKFDVIMTTYEKLASLLRHKAEWLSEVGCIIVDEIHELDSNRGPVLEIALTQLRNRNKELKILGLSATIPNSKELSEWLDAKLVESDYRPTKLIEGVLFESEITYQDQKIEKISDVEELIKNLIKENKQALVFLNSRKRAEGFAKKITKIVSKNLSTKSITKLNEASSKTLNVLESPTEQCASLSDCIKQGSAFHHAGLLNQQREIVEDNFRNGEIKVLCSTTTLSAGINLPADLVIIPSVYRFEKFSMELIPVREYKQCAGRSGRPKFSSEGKSIVLASSEEQKELILEKYINGSIEKIESKLSIVPILRTHILALIATNDIYDIKSIETFFEKTLYAKQFGNFGELLNIVLEIISDLEKFGFVENKNNFYICTPIGKRVSDLFLDPESAFDLITALKSKKTFTNISYLYAWSNCFEFSPLLNVPKNIKPLIQEEFSERLIELPYNEEKLIFGDDSLNKYFSALMLEYWIREKKEQELFKEYNLAPGVLFGKTRIIEWLAYSTIELSKVLGLEKHLLPSNKLSKRVKYGVKEELLSLVELKGIGRVRARKLFNSGIKKPSEIKSNISKVEALFGKKIADLIIKQLIIKKSTRQDSEKTIQKSL
ncbi:MAG TPA: DEAD/DEAH box helicase, partial [archaeon]|nr:DEAD/DEAH box helicase [archaeon]